MNYKFIVILIVLWASCLPSQGQEPDTIRISQSDSAQIEILGKIQDDVIILEILKIQGQIIENLNSMMEYLHEDQKKMEIKLDSALNIMSIEKENCFRKKKKKRLQKRSSD